jgi:hypothetical protein
MNKPQLVCIIIAAVALSAISLTLVGRTLTAPSSAAADTKVVAALPAPSDLTARDLALPDIEQAIGDRQQAIGDREQGIGDHQQGIGDHQQPVNDRPAQQIAMTEEGDFSVRGYFAAPVPLKSDLTYLALYAYSEVPPEKKPADIVLESLKGVPVGTPVEEIKRAAEAFGLDFNFMKAVAKIESDFDPKQRTGQYIGLFQLNNHEFNKYGSGVITSPRDNAIAAAYKFVNEATLFELDTHKQPTNSDLYLIHQQGWQGAAEHVAHPERIAWKSMCATDEGREKGEHWCKRAIWGNTLPVIKNAWKSVDKLTSAAFVQMWRERVDHLYARYSEATASDTKN